jgi:hypothetical protein
MSDWWARKLGGDTPPPAQPNPAPATPNPALLPWQYPTQPQPTQPTNYPPSTEPGYKRPVNEENYKEAIRDPASYEGLVTKSQKAGDNENCPNCNSPRYYHQAAQAIVGMHGTAVPKPRCGDCGWPNLQGPSA